MAGMLLYCLKQTAKCIGTDESNCHRRRIEEDEAFYKNWLFPRLERFYRQQGWAIGDGLAAEGTAGRQASEPAGGGPWNPPNKTKTKSRRSCSPFGRKPGSQLKQAFKRLKFTRRRDQPPVDVLHPQVGGHSVQFIRRLVVCSMIPSVICAVLCVHRSTDVGLVR